MRLKLELRKVKNGLSEQHFDDGESNFFSYNYGKLHGLVRIWINSRRYLVNFNNDSMFGIYLIIGDEN